MTQRKRFYCGVREDEEGHQSIAKYRGKAFTATVQTTMPEGATYTMRAQPRRRKEVKDEPIFLRKTYEMINSCEGQHAAWTAMGDTFVIKDPETFANEVIPRFFKREFDH